MAARRLKVGLIGAGAIANEKHLPNWRELEAEGRIELRGICDIIPERAEKAAREYGARKMFLDYRKMLKEDRYDIIDICTQNRVHAPASMAGLESGANVLVEKPMAMNARQCEAMIRAAKTAKKKLMVAQYLRFEPAPSKLKELIGRGVLGRIYTCSALWLRRRGIPGWGKFHLRRESLGGPLIDLGVHVIDVCLWLMGNPKPVAASGKTYRMFGDKEDLCNVDWAKNYPRKEFDVEDYATALVRFDNGITMNVSCSWAANIADEIESVTILGDKAGISLEPLGVYGSDGDSLTSMKFDWLPKESGHRLEIRHFTQCVEENRPVLVQPSESLRVQKIIDAIYASSAKNKEVAIK